jgi:hypothetical protein
VVENVEWCCWLSNEAGEVSVLCKSRWGKVV